MERAPETPEKGPVVSGTERAGNAFLPAVCEFCVLCVCSHFVLIAIALWQIALSRVSAVHVDIALMIGFRT